MEMAEDGKPTKSKTKTGCSADKFKEMAHAYSVYLCGI